MVYLAMKRGREGENESITTMANYLLLLSRGGGQFNNILDKALGINSIWERSDERSLTSINQYKKIQIDNSTTTHRVFECKTCNRQFPSFQALGGHRASHKKPKLMGLGANLSQYEDLETSQPKQKIHKCSICGLEFNIGQALGGHMRRHIGGGAAINEDRPPLSLTAPVVKESNSRRILCLDLNLTPVENDIYGV